MTSAASARKKPAGAPKRGRPELRVVTQASMLTTANTTEFAYDSMAEAFPRCDHGLAACGKFVIVQLRQPKLVTKGGIILDPSSRSTEHYNTQVAKVIEIGPLCFKTARIWHDPKTGEPNEVLVPNAEGPSFKPGDFVRIPRYGGDRYEVPFEYKTQQLDPETRHMEAVTMKDHCIFAIFKAHDIYGRVTSDPRTVRAYLDN